MAWLDKIYWIYLLPIAVFLAIAPGVPQPHLYEKIMMLMAGTLSKPIDIFDLLWHSWPILLIILKLIREMTKKPDENPDADNA